MCFRPKLKFIVELIVPVILCSNMGKVSIQGAKKFSFIACHLGKL